MKTTDPLLDESPDHPTTPSRRAWLRWRPRPEQMQAFRRGLRWVFLRGLATVSLLLLFAGMAVGFAGWYTSRPAFCRSCHIMEPYYVSWKESSHAHVSCVDCHFAPGVGGKVRGKLLGLVQLAKYVTATESPRPAAEIPDASCLRSGCHDTRLLSGRVDFHGVSFDHRPHFDETRLGMQIHCTSCHGQVMQGEHMAVTHSTCFLCHFKGQPFNEGPATCTRCHQIPDKPFDLGGGVMFTHELAYEKGVDCAACHGDLIRGQGDVHRERCLVCHNRPEDLARIDDHAFLHQTHVADHHVDCLACHLEIHHSLDRHKVAHAASDCASCHPDHHREQVNMLQGLGARSVPSHPGGMAATRIECRACHQVHDASATGTVLWKASAEVCATCHVSEAVEQLEAYHGELKGGYDRFQATLDRAGEALAAASLDAQERSALRAELDNLQFDVNFLREGNALHNIHYADKLVHTLAECLRDISRRLGLADPEVGVPETSDAWRRGAGP